MEKQLLSFYNLLPTNIQNIICTIYGRKQRKTRYGGKFTDYLKWLEISQWWSAKEIEEYQVKKLCELVHYAYNNIPYYKEVLDKRGIRPEDVKSLSDIKKMPLLSKEDVRNFQDKIISLVFPKNKLIHSHTSGTSGKSLQFFTTEEAIQFQWAVWWRHKKRFGVDIDDRYASFTGKGAVPITQKKPPFWRENRAFNQTVFTMHHITSSKVHSIIEKLNSEKYVYYTGYPSIIASLAAFVEDSGLSIERGPRIIFTGAETLYEDQRVLIERVFQCPVTDQYGFSEGAGNASKCEEGFFHEDFEFGILECENGEEINDGSTRGNIVATGFSNFGMPFIRYQTGDTAIWKASECKCGRKTKTLVKIEGRDEDFVITPEGSRIMRFDYIFKDSHNIKEAQVVQSKLGSVTIRIVRRKGYSKSDEKMIKDEMALRISPSLEVEFEYVNDIERTSTGKFRAVVSLLEKQAAKQ